MNDEFNHSPEIEPPNEKKGAFSNLIPTMSPVSAAIYGLIIVFVLYQIGGGILTLIIFGMDFQNADVNALRLLTTGGQLLFILLPALVFAKLVYHDVTTVIRANLPSVKEVAIFIFGLIILVPLLQEFLYIQNYLLDLMADSSSLFNSFREMLNELDKMLEDTYGSMLNADSVFEGAFIVIVVAMVPALCEEVFFRGYVQTSFELRVKPLGAAFLSALFFGLYHFNPYGLIALVILGMYFSFSAYMSNSIVVPIILHFINNFIAVIAYFAFGTDELMSSSANDAVNIGSHLINLTLLVIAFSAMIMYIKKNYSKLSQLKEA